MGVKRIDPRQQFSKWLARSSAWYLIFYLTALLVVMCIRPETAIACVYLAIIMAAVRIFDAGFYTKNSTSEKILLTMLDKAKLNLSLKSGSEKKEDDEDDEEIKGVESNG